MSTTETNSGEPSSQSNPAATAAPTPIEDAAKQSAPTGDTARPRIKIGSQRPGTPVPRIEPRVKPIFRATPPEAVRGLAPSESPPSERSGAPSPESPQPTSTPPREPRPEPDEPTLEIKPRKPRFEVAAPSGGRVEKPNLRQELPPDLEAELQAALGEGSLDELIADESPAAATTENLEPDTRLKGRVLRIHRDHVFVDLGGRNQGILLLHNFTTEPAVGTVLDVIVQKFNAEEGLYDLSAPGQSADVADWGDISEGIIVDAVITGANKGGLECTVNKLKGFIPAGQISIYRVENFEEFVGQRWPCVVMEANRERRNLVLSRRAMLEREQAEAKKKLLAELEVGQTREAIVRNLRDFGAFVDLGGVDGLIHVSQLSYDRIKHPNEVLTVGQKINVKIQKIDPDTGKIALGYRDMFESPWTNITSKYPTTSVVKGKVSRVMDFGAFVKLEPGVEGLIHISEISHKRVFRVSDVLQEGQDVEAKVMTVDPEQQRIGLSMRALEARPEPAKKPEPETVEEEPVVAAPPKKPRKVPLKGGLGRAGDGASVGLRW